MMSRSTAQVVAGEVSPVLSWSEAFHSSYERHLGDLPIAGRQAVIELRARRFRWYQRECPRKTFVEQAPVLAARYAHRTLRLRSLLEDIGLALGGRPGSRHSQRPSATTPALNAPAIQAWRLTRSGSSTDERAAGPG
jgi:hypothetical protein